jgi:hypothetical protein
VPVFVHIVERGAASHWFCAAAYLDECIRNLSLYYFQRRMGGSTVA